MICDSTLQTWGYVKHGIMFKPQRLISNQTSVFELLKSHMAYNVLMMEKEGAGMQMETVFLQLNGSQLRIIPCQECYY